MARTKHGETGGARGGKRPGKTSRVHALKSVVVKPPRKSAPSIAGVARKPHRFHPGQRTKLTQRRLQKRVLPLCTASGMARIMRSALSDVTNSGRVTAGSIFVLRDAVDGYVHRVLAAAVSTLANLTGRKTLGRDDVDFAFQNALHGTQGNAFFEFRKLMASLSPAETAAAAAAPSAQP